MAERGNTKGFGMIEVTDIIEDDEGGVVLHINIDMDDLKEYAKIGILKVLVDSLEELDADV